MPDHRGPGYEAKQARMQRRRSIIDDQNLDGAPELGGVTSEMTIEVPARFPK